MTPSDPSTRQHHPEEYYSTSMWLATRSAAAAGSKRFRARRRGADTWLPPDRGTADMPELGSVATQEQPRVRYGELRRPGSRRRSCLHGPSAATLSQPHVRALRHTAAVVAPAQAVKEELIVVDGLVGKRRLTETIPDRRRRPFAALDLRCEPSVLGCATEDEIRRARWLTAPDPRLDHRGVRRRGAAEQARCKHGDPGRVFHNDCTARRQAQVNREPSRARRTAPFRARRDLF